MKLSIDTYHPPRFACWVSCCITLGTGTTIIPFDTWDLRATLQLRFSPVTWRARYRYVPGLEEGGRWQSATKHRTRGAPPKVPLPLHPSNQKARAREGGEGGEEGRTGCVRSRWRRWCRSSWRRWRGRPSSSRSRAATPSPPSRRRSKTRKVLARTSGPFSFIPTRSDPHVN